MQDIKINAGNIKLKEPVSKEQIKQISAKLHPKYDHQLIKLIEQIPKRERSKVYRDAVMEYLKNAQ